MFGPETKINKAARTELVRAHRRRLRPLPRVKSKALLRGYARYDAWSKSHPQPKFKLFIRHKYYSPVQIRIACPALILHRQHLLAYGTDRPLRLRHPY